jgi:periplasmic copper chaperone A
LKRATLLMLTSVVLGLGLVLRAAPAPLPDLRLIDAMAPATASGATSAVVYLSVHNVGGRVDRLLDGQTSRAAHVRFYDLRRGAPGVAQDQGLDVPVGGSIDFVSTGMQLRLEGLSRPLKSGEHFALILRFRDAGALSTEVQVGAAERQPGTVRH